MPDLSQCIVLVPGFLGGRISLTPLQEELRLRRHEAICWQRAPKVVYTRPIAWYGQRLAEDLLTLRSTTEAPLNLFGWSLGGLVSVAAMQALANEYVNPHDIVRKVITFGTPWSGTWAAYPAMIFDHVLGLNARELRRGHATLMNLLAFLHEPRHWRFHAIHGTRDLLVSAKQKDLPPDWRHEGPHDHNGPLYDPHLFNLIHTLVLKP